MDCLQLLGGGEAGHQGCEVPGFKVCTSCSRLEVVRLGKVEESKQCTCGSTAGGVSTRVSPVVLVD